MSKNYIDYKKNIKVYKKENEKLRERIKLKNYELENIKQENINLKKMIKELKNDNDGYKKEVNMLYESINDLTIK